MASDSFYWRTRRRLARIKLLQSTYYLFRSIHEARIDSGQITVNELDKEYTASEDPWHYADAPHQVERIRREIDMLQAVCGQQPFNNVLEVGCSEGLFTEKLSTLCKSLQAFDISQVAMERAKKRLQGSSHVKFELSDIRSAELSEKFDLIVVIHALEYVRSPLHMRTIRKKLVDALAPGGYLLLGNMVVTQIYEEAWWGRFIPRSGQRINGFFARHPALTVERRQEIQLGPELAHDMLLRKRI